MAARRRVSADTSANPPQTEDSSKAATKSPETAPPDPPIAPPKSGFILKLSICFLAPYLYLINYYYNIDLEVKRSILINAGLSLAGYFVTVRMIPVASRYVLRRNLFGYDINKKGTPQGSVKVWVFLRFLTVSRRNHDFLSIFCHLLQSTNSSIRILYWDELPVSTELYGLFALLADFLWARALIAPIGMSLMDQRRSCSEKFASFLIPPLLSQHLISCRMFGLRFNV